MADVAAVESPSLRVEPVVLDEERFERPGFGREDRTGRPIGRVEVRRGSRPVRALVCQRHRLAVARDADVGVVVREGKQCPGDGDAETVRGVEVEEVDAALTPTLGFDVGPEVQFGKREADGRPARPDVGHLEADDTEPRLAVVGRNVEAGRESLGDDCWLDWPVGEEGVTPRHRQQVTLHNRTRVPGHFRVTPRGCLGQFERVRR